MARPSFTITYTEPRSRLTNFFRYILAIPHLLISWAWGYLTNILTVLQWFVVLFTGKRNEGMWKMQNAWLGYAARVNSYFGLMFDQWPNIGPEPNGEPISYSFQYEASANRLSNFFRILWIIPAAVIALVFLVVAYIATVVCWFVILVTGNQPRGLFDLLAKVHSYMVQLNAYWMLMTDDYPKYGV